jgi:hypothetical protein
MHHIVIDRLAGCETGLDGDSRKPHLNDKKFHQPMLKADISSREGIRCARLEPQQAATPAQPETPSLRLLACPLRTYL